MSTLTSNIERARQMADRIRISFASDQIQVEQVLLFGSRARNAATEESDWDFLVIVTRPISRDERRFAIFHAQRDLAHEFVEPTNILVSSMEDLQQSDAPTQSVTSFALREGIPL